MCQVTLKIFCLQDYRIATNDGWLASEVMHVYIYQSTISANLTLLYLENDALQAMFLPILGL